MNNKEIVYQIKRCLVGACDDTCPYYYYEKKFCDTMDKFVPIAEKFLDRALNSLEGYDFDCIIKHFSGGCSYNETGCSGCVGKENIKIALEKQIAKKPILNNPIINNLWCEDAKLCPICHTYVDRYSLYCYCKNCGQKLDLDWGNEDAE